MSTYAPDFLQIGLASGNADSCIGSSFVLSRRIRSAAIIVVLSSDLSPLRVSCIAAVNARLHDASSVDPQTIAAALVDGLPVLTGRGSTTRLAQSFLRAALAAGSSGAEPVRSVIAVRMRSREDVLFRRRLGTALAASLAAHFLLTTWLHWLPGSREATSHAARR